MRSGRAVLLAIVFCFAALGCEEKVVDPNAPTVAASPLVMALCDGLKRCCYLNRDGYSDLDKCRTYFNALEAAADPTRDLAACTAILLARHASDDLCTLGTVEGGEDRCADLFQPASAQASRGLGETCTFDEQCGPPGVARCSHRGGGSPSGSVCMSTERGKPGDGPCVGTKLVDETIWIDPGDTPTPDGYRAYLCHGADDLFCDRETRVCRQAGSPGELCSGEGECKAALGHCPGISDGPPTCRRWQTFGEHCSSLTPCAPGLGCADAVCVAGRRYGERCDRYDECASGRCEDGRCTTTSAIGIGTCFP